MRKQIVNLLTVAMLALTVGTIFSSCKDYDDEMYADLNGQIVDLNSNLSTLIGAQAKELEDLKAALEAAKADCENKYNSTQTSLKNKQDSINALDAKIKALEAESATHATKAELAAAKADLQAQIDALEADVTDIKAQMATKQQLDDAITAINNSIAETNAKFDGEILKANVRMDSIIANMQSNVINVTNSLTTLQTATENLAKADEEIKDSIAKLQEQMEEAQAFFTSEVSTVAATAAAAASKADANAKELEALKEVVNNIKQCTDCDALKERCTVLETKVAAIENEITAIKEQAEKNLAEAKKYADEAVKVVAEELKTLSKEINTKLKDMESAYKVADTKLQTQINDLKKADKALQKQIDKNATAIDELTEGLSDVKDALNKRISSVVLQGAYSPVVGYFALPTGAKSNILATYYGMPMYEVNFPTASTIRYVDGIVAFDERVMELLGFDDNDGSFHAGVSYPANQPLVADTANAGKLYLTINPNDVDLSETTFKLVNSLGEESPAILGEVKKSSEKLTFGYTRAGAVNGFYEVTANIAPADVENATIRINKSDIKDIVSEFKNFSDGINITDVATKFYSIINDVADANAIEATWTDSLGEHSVYSDYGIAAVAVEPLSYNFMKDVNMTSFPGLNRVSNLVNSIIDKVNISIPDIGISSIKVPEIEKIEIKDLSPELLAKFNVTIKDTVEYELDLDVPVDDVIVNGQNINVPGTEVIVPAQQITVPSRVVDVTFSDATTGTTTIPEQVVTVPQQTVKVDGQTVWVDGQTVHIPNVKYHDVLEIPIEVSYDMTDAVKDLYGEMTGSIEDVNKMLGDLEDFMDDINDILSDLKKIEDIETSIVDAKDKIKNELNRYIDKLNNKLCGLVNSINGKMQPTMLVKTTDGFSMLSTIKGKPSVFNSASAVLVPTSFNAEILAPAFKKYVAVSNVIDAATGNNAYDGDATCVSVLKAANSGDLNKVLEGSTREVAFNGQAGYIYEIIYSAVDYDGFISNSKYYVKIQ